MLLRREKRSTSMQKDQINVHAHSKTESNTTNEVSAIKPMDPPPQIPHTAHTTTQKPKKLKIKSKIEKEERFKQKRDAKKRGKKKI